MTWRLGFGPIDESTQVELIHKVRERGHANCSILIIQGFSQRKYYAYSDLYVSDLVFGALHRSSCYPSEQRIFYSLCGYSHSIY